MTWKKLLLIGDSHTEYGYLIDNQAGWVSLLSNLLQRKCDVKSRGFSGYNTTNILTYLPEILAEFDKDSIQGVILLIGSNDSASGTCHIPLEKYSENLQEIHSCLVETFGLKRDQLIVICPPRIDDEKCMWEGCQKEPVWKYSDKSVEQYSRVCAEFAIKNGLIFIDLYSIMLRYGNNYKEFLSDGLHLSAKGNVLLYEHLKLVLERTVINDLEYKYPSWEHVNDIS